jgi:activating signal cointegrator complex subunit 3
MSILQCAAYIDALAILGLPGYDIDSLLDAGPGNDGSAAEPHFTPIESAARYMHERESTTLSSHALIAREAVRAAFADDGPKDDADADENWLVHACAMNLAESGRLLATSWTPLTLGLHVMEIARRGTDFEGALLDLLGEESFDFLAELASRRPQLARFTPSNFTRVCKGYMAEAELEDFVSRAAASELGQRAGPRLGTGVTVQSLSALHAEKLRRKLENKVDRAKQGGAPSGSTEMMVLAPRKITEAAPASGGGRKLISVDEAIAAVGAGHGGLQQVVLPEGTTTTTHPGFQEVNVPAPAKPVLSDSAPGLVSIASLEPLAQIAFTGITALNRLQSFLFQAAYRTNENLLVCAPTGAGKTNVAMLAVCHELLQHVQPDGRHLRKDEFKIVYVAPMKALAAEVVDKMSERLSRLGLVVRELTGDMQLTKKEIEATQVIVTTPEKWDVLTRKAGDGTLISLVRLLIIDEVSAPSALPVDACCTIFE